MTKQMRYNFIPIPRQRERDYKDINGQTVTVISKFPYNGGTLCLVKTESGRDAVVDINELSEI